MKARIEEFLTHSPSREMLSADELAWRHHACRGRSMCAADQIQGFALNNTFCLLGEGEVYYPLKWMVELKDQNRLWCSLDTMVAWVLTETGEHRLRRGVELAAAVTHAINEEDLPSAPYWWLHVQSFILAKENGGQEKEIAQLMPWLPSAISARNREGMAPIWVHPEKWSIPRDSVRQLVASILAADGRPLNARWHLLREIVHTLFLQLGVAARYEIAIVLFACERALDENP